MKKILALLIAAGAFVSLHAQSREQAREVILGDRYPSYQTYPNGRSYGNDHEYRIDQVNREYYARLQSINNDPYINRRERKRMIKELERDRNYRIEQINRDFANRHDNGRHRGWYKD